MPQTCSQCQAEASDDATYCARCGAPLNAALIPPPPPPPPPMGNPTAAPGGAAGAAGQPGWAGPTGPAGAAASGAGASPTQSSGGSNIPAFRFDANRWTLADRIAGIATFVLFISLFLDWFTASVGALSGSESGLSAHWYLYLVLIICIAIVVYLVLRSGWDRLPINQDVPHLTVMMAATIVNLVLTFLAFIFKPSGLGIVSVGWSFGAFLALIAAIAAAAPYCIPALRSKTM
jgi:zinc-ribbon domain